MTTAVDEVGPWTPYVGDWGWCLHTVNSHIATRFAAVGVPAVVVDYGGWLVPRWCYEAMYHPMKAEELADRIARCTPRGMLALYALGGVAAVVEAASGG